MVDAGRGLAGTPHFVGLVGRLRLYPAGRIQHADQSGDRRGEGRVGRRVFHAIGLVERPASAGFSRRAFLAGVDVWADRKRLPDTALIGERNKFEALRDSG